MERVIEKANDIVQNYSSRKLTEAVKRVEKERCGEGCGCINCAKLAVSEVNSWVDWVGSKATEEYLDSVRYKLQIERSGSWKIKQGK